MLLPIHAICSKGFETILAQEIENLISVKNITKGKGSVFFYSNGASVLKLNLWARIPSRILIQLGKTQVKNAKELYNFTKKISWENWFDCSKSFKVDINGWGMPKDVSLRFASLKVKDAICDRFREKAGMRPNVETGKPDMRIWVNFENNLTTISIDTSGESLFKRGWRKNKIDAPIKENLVAGLLAHTNWSPHNPLFDPMCGSGTFIIEAASQSHGLPANFNPVRKRKFACDKFSKDSPFGGFDIKKLEAEALKSWQKASKKPRFDIFFGRDIDENAIEIAKNNARLALPESISQSISWEIGPIKDMSNSKFNISEKGTIVTNPPFGERLKIGGSPLLYEQFGELLRTKFSGWDVWILSNDKSNFYSEIKLKPSSKVKLFNGNLACTWSQFKIF